MSLLNRPKAKYVVAPKLNLHGLGHRGIDHRELEHRRLPLVVLLRAPDDLRDIAVVFIVEDRALLVGQLAFIDREPENFSTNMTAH
jgi:hypothetical protein